MHIQSSIFKCISAFLSNAINPYRVFIALMIAVIIWLVPMLTLTATPVAAQDPDECCVQSAWCGYGPPSNRCCVNWGPCEDPPPVEPTPTSIPPTPTPIPPTPIPPTPTPVPQPPSISGSLNCSQTGNNGWCVGNLSLDLTASDPQGQPIIISGNLNGNIFACPSGNTSCSVPLVEGVGTVTYLVNSMTGLTANGSQSYQQDNSSPQINGSLNGSTGANGWYVSDVSFSGSASDSISGLSTFEYSIDNAVWTPYSSLLTLSDGIHTFNLRAVDNAGNQSVTSQTFSIDTLTPTLDLSITGTPGNGGWYKSNPQVTVTANDSGSGLASFEYNLDSSGWIAYTGVLTLIDGAHTLSVRAMDAAGNVTQTDQQIDVDTITPLINISPNGTRGGGGWYISDLKVNASSSDNGAGLASFEYSLNDSTWTPYIGTLPYTEGQHNLKFRATDNAGNVTTTPVQTYRVDTTPPFIHMPSKLYLGEITQYSVQDHGSQLAFIRIAIEDSNERYGEIAWEEYPSGTTFSDEFLWNGKFKDKEKAAEGTYFETIKASDIAGNQSIMTGSIIVESDLLSYILPPFVPPVNTPVSIPTSVAPLEESASFGGEENPIPSSPEMAETGIVSVGGETTITTGGPETQSFESQSSTSSQSTDLPNSNVLWGATAAAAVGAFASEVQRRRKEEEEAQRKKREEEEAYKKREEEETQRKKRVEEEARAMQKASRQADGPSRSKQYRDIGEAYAASMKVKKQKEEAEKQRKKIIDNSKLARQEQQTQADFNRAIIAEKTIKERAQKAHDDFRAGERSGDSEIVQAWNEQQKENSWWEKTIDWIDNHQTAIAFGIGVAVGIGAIILTAGTATPLVVAGLGAAAVAAGTITLGTIGLNAHYDRPLGTNIVKNVLVGASAAAATAFIVGGGLQLALIKLGNGVAAACTLHPNACGRAEWALNAIDKLEEGSLIVKGAIQTWTGDSQGAADTQNELQMEYMDGGMPGNTVAKELGGLSEDALELALKYGDDAIPLMLKYGDDAVNIIGAYGDDGIELLTAHGDDAVDLIKKYGTPAVDLLQKHGEDAIGWTKKLEPLISSDTFEYALGQGPDAVEALSKWPDNLLLNYGDELALRAGTDAKALEAAKELAKLKDLNNPRAKELIAIIAKNSTNGGGNRLILGKWVPGSFEDGFIGVARNDGGMFYSTNPGVEEIFNELGSEQAEYYWAVNQQVLQNTVDSRLNIDYSFDGLNPAEVETDIAAIDAINYGKSREEVAEFFSGKFPFRMREAEFLLKQGYTYQVDLISQTIRWVAP